MGLFLLIFLSGYEPFFGYPPIRKAEVKAEVSTQVQTVNASALPFSFQLPHPGYISTYFSTYHPAIDIATGLGMPVHALAEGTVAEAGYNLWGLGLTVVVDHGAGYSSLYAHMGKIYVKTGQKVDKMATLGEVGLTGRTSGPHTHLELKKDGAYINPQPLLPTLVDLGQTFKTQAQPAVNVQKEIKASL